MDYFALSALFLGVYLIPSAPNSRLIRFIDISSFMLSATFFSAGVVSVLP